MGSLLQTMEWLVWALADPLVRLVRAGGDMG